jgi:hypothetical protein
LLDDVFDVEDIGGTSLDVVDVFPKGLMEGTPIGFVFGGSFGTRD